jgi:CheY-like chemotaxis protein
MQQQVVLSIECNWRIRKLIRANLEAVGLEVWEAVGGRHSLQLLARGTPDLILLDLDIDDMEAEQLVIALRRSLSGPEVPIIVTAAEPPDRRLLGPGLAKSYLQKPFSARALLGQVAQALPEALLLPGDPGGGGSESLPAGP